LTEHSVDGATRVPDHERIRRDAAAHPERSYREHVEAARAIAGRTYVEDLQRIQLRTAISATVAEIAEDRDWADAESADEASALDDLRASLGHMPTDRERAAFLGGFREARAELMRR